MISLSPLTHKQKATFSLFFVFLVFIIIVGAFWIQKYYTQKHLSEQGHYTPEDQDEQKWRATLPQLNSEPNIPMSAESTTEGTEPTQSVSTETQDGVSDPSQRSDNRACENYSIADGYILSRGTKTEIPEIFCHSSNVRGLESFRNEYYTLFLYRGENKSYILADPINLDTSSEGVTFYIVQLNELNPQFLVLLGSSTTSFVFADKTQVVLVKIDPDYDSPSFSIEANGLPNADPNTLIVLNDRYIKDASTVFFDGVKIDDADATTFEVLGPRYARDKNSVYFEGKSVLDADVKSFEVVGDYAGGFESPSHSVARDKNWYWYESQRIFSIPKDTTLYTYKRLDWTDPNTYFSDDSYLYAYNPEGTLKTKIPSDILQSAEVKILPGNVKHVVNYLMYLQCSSSPSLTYTSSTDYMTKIPIPVDEEELSKFCKVCTRCDRK